MKRLYVLTCHTDESQLPALQASLRQQEGVEVVHEIISGKDAIGAEQAVHAFSLQAAGFDVIVKMDADMTLTGPTVLASIARWFEAHPEADRLTLPVLDYYLGEFISGMHSYRPSAVPATVVVAEPNPDTWIGSMQGPLLYGLRRNLVNHSFDPSRSQAVRFGLHRGIKARLGGSRHRHWGTVHTLYRQYQRRPHETGLKFALMGALIGIGAIPFDGISFGAINRSSQAFESILTFCVAQEADNFPVLRDLRLRSILDYHAQTYGSLRDRTYLRLRAVKVRLMALRDGWLRDRVSSGARPAAVA